MKKITILLSAAIAFSFAPIHYEHITETKWKTSEQNHICISLKKDHTLWHYSMSNKQIKDSLFVCKWNIDDNVMKLTWDINDLSTVLTNKNIKISNFVETYEIVYCGSKKLILKNLKSGEKILYSNNN